MEPTTIVTIIIIVLAILSFIFIDIKIIKKGIVANLNKELAENPELLNRYIEGSDEHKKTIIDTIKTFKEIKSIKRSNKSTIDLEIIQQDDSAHWYRAETNGSLINPKILSLNKYS